MNCFSSYYLLLVILNVTAASQIQHRNFVKGDSSQGWNQAIQHFSKKMPYVKVFDK